MERNLPSEKYGNIDLFYGTSAKAITGGSTQDLHRVERGLCRHANDPLAVVNRVRNARTVGPMVIIILPRRVIARDDERPSLPKVGLEIGMSAVDTGIDNGNVSTITCFATAVSDLGVDSIDSIWQRLSERLHPTVFFSIPNIRPLPESLDSVLVGPDRERVEHELVDGL